MWRAFAALLLSLLALAWATMATAVCFFYASIFFRDLFGRFGSFYGALTAFVLSIVGAKILLRLADKVIEPYSGPFEGKVYDGAPRDIFYLNWPRFAAEIVRNRRYAFYARTRQWDKLAALEAARPAGGTVDSGPVGIPEPPEQPRRTSMATYLSPEETRRGARRMAERRPSPRADHVFVADE